MPFWGGDFVGLRELVARTADDAGLSPTRRDDLVLAVHELATNSVRHGGGAGTLRHWREGGELICEVRDAGHIDDPLVDRRRPPGDQPGGYGLWLANRLCDLVQLRTGPHGSVVRLHMRID
jgi:anti-sigma regulatory factor (Ser/Thr protein kinase)